MPRRDPTATVVFIFAILGLLIGLVFAYQGYSKNEEAQADLQKEQMRLRDRQTRSAALDGILDRFSAPVGFEGPGERIYAAWVDTGKLGDPDALARLLVQRKLAESTDAVLETLRFGTPARRMVCVSHDVGAEEVEQILRASEDIRNAVSFRKDGRHAWSQTGAMQDFLNRMGTEAPGDWGTWSQSSSGITLRRLIEALEEDTAKVKQETEQLRTDTRSVTVEVRKILGDKDPKSPEAGELATAASQRDMSIRSLRESVRSLRERISRDAEEAEQRLSALEREIASARADLDDAKVANRARIATFEEKVTELNDRIASLRRHAEAAEKDVAADGSILEVDEKGLLAWMDIGLRDGLYRGLAFKVYALEKGEMRHERGLVRVLDIEDDYSRVAVISLADPAQPIVAGDLVQSDIFRRNQARVIVFAGRLLGKYTNEQAQRKIEERGVRVKDEVTLDTNYVVIGRGYDADPNYSRANELGVKVIRERDLYDMLQID